MSIGSDGDSDFSLHEDETFIGNGDENNIDYYAILNVAKNASVEEINQAYKRRCLIFHPDRHTDEDDKKEASKIFVILRKAHETLTDPVLRQIYDTVGVRGLEMEGWQLVQRSSNPENIRKEYEFLQRLRENEIMLQRVHPSTNFNVKASVCGLFAENPEDRYAPQLVGMLISQSVETPITAKDKIALTGRVKSFNGRGDGSFIASFRKSVSSSIHFDVSSTIAPEYIGLSTKFSTTVTQRSVFVIQPSIQWNWLVEEINYGMMLLYTIQLKPNWHGTLALNYGSHGGSLTTSIVQTESDRPKFIANFTLSPVNPNVRLVYNDRYPENDFHYEASCTLGLYGITPTFGFERRLSRFSKIAASLSLSLPTCLLQAQFRLKTSNHHYDLKVVLCDNKDDIARSTVYGVLLPMAVISFAKIVFRRPLEKFMRVFEDRTEDDQVNEKRKEEAQKVIHLMRGTAEKIAKEEEQKGGLVVVEAQYGQLSDDLPGAELYPVAGEQVIDVTIPVQALVNDSQLRIYSTKDQLPGFYDPCPGEKKMLKIVYRFHGELHTVTVHDDQPLNIPLRAHRVNRT
ncbi:dnaJ domain-containing protein [Ditylenchus destructor]|nr:dnaJ domain-containing protein [Ditylenchus destructor]